MLLIDAIKRLLPQDFFLGEDFYCVSEETLVRTPILSVYNHILNGNIRFKSKPFYIKKFFNATVFPNSDFVLVGHDVIWPKYWYAHFTKLVPCDKQLIKIDGSHLYIKKPKKVFEKSVGFSLCGAHSTVWSHFLVQFLPKIEYIDNIIKDSTEIVTIITPWYLDPQINEIILKLTEPLDGAEVLRLREDEAVYCRTLYNLESTSLVSDHTPYISPSDFIIPSFVKSFLKDKFIKNPILFSQTNNPKPLQHRKLYLARKTSPLSPLSGSRNLINSAEIEGFFMDEGFEFVYPHEYSLEEKKTLFSEASIIAGPYSSGFSNIIFCQPNTQVLVFLNFQRIYETYLPSLADFFEIEVLAVTGKDLAPENIHSSYYIPAKTIKEAYSELVRNNE